MMATTQAAPAVEIRGVRKGYGPVRAVDGVDLTIAAGEVVALLGPDGAGKTTLLRAGWPTRTLRTGSPISCLRSHAEAVRASALGVAGLRCFGLNALMRPFTEDDLRRLAGAKSFARGQEYREIVMEVRRVRGGVTATVSGTHDYTVRLAHDGTGLSGACTCPMGEGGVFCKHCVALGLALLSGGPDATGEDVDDTLLDGDGEDERLRGHLDTLDRDTLAGLLWEHAAADPGLYGKLSLHAVTQRKQSKRGQAKRAGARKPAGPDASALRRQLNSQLRVRGFIPYHGAPTYTRAAHELLDLIEQVAAGGQAGDAEALARRAVELITDALTEMDDSSGIVGEALARAVELHQQACRAAPPDPSKLASWVIRMVVEGPGWPDLGVDDYAEALGDAGLAAYRAELESMWEALPPLPKEDRPYGMGFMLTEADMRASHRRWAVTHLMEELALRDGDVDAFVRVIGADLGSAWQHLRAATALEEAGRAAEALAWAERGHRAYPDRRDHRLTGFLAGAYQRAGRTEAAISVWREQFTSRPTLDFYLELHAVAEPAGRWAAVRAEVLPALDDAPYGGSVLAKILLWEGDVAAAWETAKTRGTLPDVLLEVVQAREVTHPADVIPTYERFVADQIDRKNKTGYRTAAGFIEHLRELYDRAGDAEYFPVYLEDVRKRHKAKRNLMAELARRGL